MKKDKYFTFLSGCALVFIIGISFIRMFYGAELSDEAYSVAEPFIVAKGAIPFVDNWCQIPGWSLLIAPVIKVFLLLTGNNTEGIFLFTRMVAFIFSLMAMWIVYRLLHIEVEAKGIRILYVMAYIVPFFYGLTAFRADKIMDLLSWISGVLVCISLQKPTNLTRHTFMAGVLAALSILCYPQYIVSCIMIVIFMFLVERKERRGFKKTFNYILGGLVSAIVVTAYFFYRSGVDKFIQGMKYEFTDVMYFQLKGQDKLKDARMFFQEVFSEIIVKKFGIPFVFIMLICTCVIRIFLKKREYKKISLLALGFTTIYTLSTFVYHYRGDGLKIIYYECVFLTLLMPIYFSFVKKKKQFCFYMMMLVGIPQILQFLVTAITTYSLFWSRTINLVNTALLTVLFMSIAMYENFSDVVGINSIVKYISIPIALTVSISMLANVFMYIYRDDNFNLLTQRIESGVYKGIYTTPERVGALIEVEGRIREYTDGSDRVLVMESAPFGYCMTDAQPCTPSTWDQALYSYGFNYPDTYLDYFKITDTEPTKIIYIDYGRDAMLSIDKDDYKFNDYVIGNYDIVYENREMIYPLLIFQRKDLLAH